MSDRRILDLQPLPVARGYRRYLNAAEVRERHDSAYYLYEIYLKYLASSAIAHYVSGDLRDHRVNAVLKGLARPSLGEWLRFLREGVAFLAGQEKTDSSIHAIHSLLKSKQSRWQEVVQLANALRALRTGEASEREKVTLGALLEEIVSYRNRVLGHGAPLGPKHYEEFGDLFGSAFPALLRESPFLTAHRLVLFDTVRVKEGSRIEWGVIEYMSDRPIRKETPFTAREGSGAPRQGALFLLAVDGGLTCLDPLLVAYNDDVYILNDAAGAPEYISYSTGERYRPANLGENQGKLFEQILGYDVDSTRLSRIGEDVAAGAAEADEARREDQRCLGDFRILRETGRGGMGTVFEAIQESLGRKVALKVLPGTFALDPKRVERFRREARATARVHHPHIIPVYDVGEAEGTHYYAMEHIAGTSLDQLLAKAREDSAKPPRQGRSSSARSSSTADPDYISHAVAQIAGVAEGLDAAHRLGLVHRDVKPSNILVDADGRYVLVDFGLVHEEEAQTLTRSGEMVGTLTTMSPEQVSRSPVDSRADVYSLGVTLYEILTLEAPFARKTDHETQRAILFEEPVPPRRLNPRLNRDLETIILRALEKHPDARYASAGEFAADLRRFLRYEPIQARPISGLSRLARRIWRHRGAWAAVAAIFLLLLTSGGLYFWNRYQEHLRAVERYEPTVLAQVMKMQRSRLILAAGGGAPDPEETGVGAVPVGLASLATEGGEDAIEEAARELARAAASVAGRPDAYYHRARALLLLGRAEEALTEAEQALDRRPDFVPAIILKAALLESLGEFEEARAVRAQTLQRAGGGWATHWLDAHRARGEQRWQAAAEAYEKLIQLESGEEPPYLGSAIDSRLGRAVALLEAGEFDEARIEFRVACSNWPRFMEPTLLLGKTYYLMGEEHKAEETFQEIHSSPHYKPYRDEVAVLVASLYDSLGNYEKGLDWVRKMSVEWLRERASVALLKRLGRPREAVKAAERACKLQPDDPRALFELGWAYRHVGRRSDGDKVLEEAAARAAGDPRLAIHVASLRASQGRWDDAETFYRRALKADLRSSAARTGLAVVRRRRGDLEGAESLLRDTVKVNPDDTAHDRWHGILQQLGRLDDAVKFYQQSLRRNPKSGFLHYQLARVFQRQGETRKAEESYLRATDLKPRLRNLYWYYGNMLREFGKREQAIEMHKKAIGLRPDSYSSCNYVGLLLMEEGRFEDAIPYLQKAVALAPLKEWHLRNLLQALEGAGRLEAAVASYREAARSDPDYALAHFHLAVALDRQGEKEEAVESYKKALAVNGELCVVSFKLGICLADLDRLPEAETHLLNALDIPDDNDEILFHLAIRVYAPQGRLDDAAKTLGEAIRLKRNGSYMYECLGDMLEEQGLRDQAVDAYCDAIKARPWDAQRAHGKLQSFLLAHGDYPGFAGRLDGLIERLESYCAAASGEARVRSLRTLALGLLYHPERRKPEKALPYAQAAVEESRWLDSGAVRTLADVQVAIGQYPEALLTVEKAVRLTGDPALELRAETYAKKGFPDLRSYASIDTYLSACDFEVLIRRDATWHYFPGTREPSAGTEWTQPNFPDAEDPESGWRPGQSGFGYGDGDDRTELPDMRGNHTTVYIRTRFQVTDPKSVEGLWLSMLVDDGFVAYLNGEEVARVGAGAPTERMPYDGQATRTTDNAEPSVHWLDPKLLRAGENCLAIQGLNASKDSSDLSLIPCLKAKRPRDAERDRHLLEEFRPRGEEAERLTAYLEARLLERSGKLEEAATKLLALVAEEKEHPEPHLRLAEVMLRQGKHEEACNHYAGALSSGAQGNRQVWIRWLQSSFKDLGLEPAAVLATLPPAAPLSPADDVRWLLERLVAGKTIRIDCGGKGASGTWRRDAFYEGGRSSSGARSIEGTEDDLLYTWHRWFSESDFWRRSGERVQPGYRIPVPPGSYRVTLHFAEANFTESGNRSFDVLLEGRTVLEDFDVAQEARIRTAHQETFEGLSVEDGILDIEFLRRHDNPFVAAIEICRDE